MGANTPETGGDSPPRPGLARSTPRSIQRALRAAAEDVVVWRKLRGLTQEQLADRAGVSVNTLRRLENADGGIGFENVLRILRGLGVLESVQRALDPYETDVGRLRSDEQLPRRVRPRDLTRPDHRTGGAGG
jgi:transcriptional regulator with XRE-family HTH domain